jgi:hypothetical protein
MNVTRNVDYLAAMKAYLYRADEAVLSLQHAQGASGGGVVSVAKRVDRGAKVSVAFRDDLCKEGRSRHRLRRRPRIVNEVMVVFS